MSSSLCGNVSASSTLSSIRSLDPAKNPLYKAHDDISVARLFADCFKDVARYNVSAKAWFVYDGIKWKKDIEGMFVESFAKLLARSLLVYSADLEDSGYSSFVSKLQDRKRRTTMITDARDFYPIDYSDFDTDPYLFNCQNCVLNLRTLETIEHDPALLLSKVSNVVYNKDATSPDFEKFLSEAMQGNVDKIEYLQRLFGYSLSGRNPEEELYLCYGSTTRNGKSTLLDTIEYVFGDYGANCQPETLAQKERNASGTSGDVARLNGVRFLHCGEPPKRMLFDVPRLKQMTGGDKITARNLYESEVEFTTVFKLFINTNYLPLVTDDTLFASGRVKVITFDRHFEPEEQDTKLKPRLKSPENISGIFNWILDGLMKYQEDGEILKVPEDVRIATDDYRKKSDKIKLFMQDCLIPVPSNVLSAKYVYETYAQWCRENGFKTESKSNFLDELRAKGLLYDRGTVDGKTTHNVVKGYMLDVTTIPDPGFPFN